MPRTHDRIATVTRGRGCRRFIDGATGAEELYQMSLRTPWTFEVDERERADALIDAAGVPIDGDPASYLRPVRRVGRARPDGMDFAPAGPSSRPAGRALLPTWKHHIATVQAAMERSNEPMVASWPVGRALLYVIDVPRTAGGDGLFVELLSQTRRAGTITGEPRPARISRDDLAALPDLADRRILSLLAAATDPETVWPVYWRASYGSVPACYLLPPAIWDPLVPLMCRTGRCRLRVEPSGTELAPLEWDTGKPWRFHVEVREDASGRYVVGGALRRDGERMDLSDPLLILADGFVFTRERAARLDDAGAFPWMQELRRLGSLPVSRAQGAELLAAIVRMPRVPPLDLPDELRYEEVSVTPRPRLSVRSAPPGWGVGRVVAHLSFDYDGVPVADDDRGRGVLDAERRRLLIRDHAAEDAAASRLVRLRLRQRVYVTGTRKKTGLDVAASRLPRLVATLIREGWEVDADGKLYRRPGALRMEVRSGIDWFELHGTAEFGDASAALPVLLAALRRGEQTVLLGDGSYGVLPEPWLRKYALLATLGTATNGHVRFSRGQVGVLDALLAATPEATCDAAFARARDELRRFDGIAPCDAPLEFVGHLRPYQREGLGWLSFLGRFGFGGCLADDMGLGKTVQVLALLETRRAERERCDPTRTSPRPSLVVVPKSLVFNWKAEAARFTPKLAVLDHTGIDRLRGIDHVEDYDLVITTYGTLRRDVVDLKDARFDYVILDEAQAVKNADTESAKAVRLLRAQHRLALSGTPVQNHLGELWSLFGFLNPGLLGPASALGSHGARTADAETREMLGRMLRPFILRRTKDQVAPELPGKLEQTIHCELDGTQRARYDQLRVHYRHALLGRVARDGVARSAIHILEALLRLRQAACHPGLIDPTRVAEPSAKLDVLVPRLAEVAEQGHKALVFSQFTSLLAIVRAHLDRGGLRYEYLDGRTRDRAERIRHFQSDPDCRLFLISLKAGGLGLNLTAAEYVFLLDPWWNPAVEAQAIDRTHRIGQTRPVFAYRLIARDTVEDRIVELQQTKRDLAAAIITADNSLIRTLSREDLERLLT
jgi:superfamily II DNA or RNA helicase